MTEEQMYSRVQYIYEQCSLLIMDSLGTVPRTAGNVAIFCQSSQEFTAFKGLAERLVRPSDNPAQKYFQLITPIAIKATGEIPGTMLSWLYVRQPAADSPESGDVDYVLSRVDYGRLKNEVREGKVKNATLYDRPSWDMIELRNKKYDGLPYITVQAMAEKARVRF